MQKEYKYNNWIIRQATEDDLNDIVEIWTEGVKKQTTDTEFNLNQVNFDFKSQILNQNNDFKFWVCVNNENTIIGWQSITPFHNTPNYAVKSIFAQSSTYVKHNYQKEGVGKILLTHALEYCKNKSRIKHVFGLVLSENKASLKLCDEIGFHNLGTLPNQGKKEYSNWDILVYET